MHQSLVLLVLQLTVSARINKCAHTDILIFYFDWHLLIKIFHINELRDQLMQAEAV